MSMPKLPKSSAADMGAGGVHLACKMSGGLAYVVPASSSTVTPDAFAQARGSAVLQSLDGADAVSYLVDLLGKVPSIPMQDLSHLGTADAKGLGYATAAITLLHVVMLADDAAALLHGGSTLVIQTGGFRCSLATLYLSQGSKM